MSKSNGNGTDWKDQFKFDFNKITAKRISELRVALNTADTNAAAAIYAEIIIECPPSWGAPNDPETYINRPYYTEFQDLAGIMGEAGKNVRAS
jgi:hypothetical protein